MDEAHKELVKRLRERPFRHASESELEAAERRQSERVKAALALEALAEQRDRFVERFNETRQELNAITAERDRLKAENDLFYAFCNAAWSVGGLDVDWIQLAFINPLRVYKARKALGDVS